MRVPLTPEALTLFVLELANDPARWHQHVRRSDGDRVYEQIWSDEDVNAWVICWSEDHDTGFHDHDESAAAVAVISGRVREERLTIGAQPLGRELGAGAW